MLLMSVRESETLASGETVACLVGRQSTLSVAEVKIRPASLPDKPPPGAGPLSSSLIHSADPDCTLAISALKAVQKSLFSGRKSEQSCLTAFNCEENLPDLRSLLVPSVRFSMSR